MKKVEIQIKPIRVVVLSNNKQIILYTCDRGSLMSSGSFTGGAV